ncbi:hypothetical protein PHISP_08635, partial [Aspergillus sp. HF37]
DRAQFRGRVAVQAPWAGGGHGPAAAHRRIQLQERRAGRPDGVRGIHHRLRLGDPAGPGRHRQPGAAGERLPLGGVLRRRHQADRFQDRGRTRLGQRFHAPDRGRRDQPRQLPAVG